MRSPLLPFPSQRETPTLFQIHNANYYDHAEVRSYCGFILLYDDDVFEDRDDIPIMCEMEDNCHNKSDNFGTQRLYLNVNPRVVSAVCPRDRTVTQLLHNKPIADELMVNLALTRWTSPTSPRSSCKSSATRCSPSART